jgi:hypothetical protein
MLTTPLFPFVNACETLRPDNFDLYWLLRISVRKSASQMTLSDPFALHLYIKQKAILLLTLLFTALFWNRYPKLSRRPARYHLTMALFPSPV